MALAWGCGDDGVSGTSNGTDGTTTTGGPDTVGTTTASTSNGSADETSTTTPNSTSSTSPTTGESTSTTSGADSSSDGGTTMQVVDGSGSSTTGGGVCNTVLCGNPEVCCEATEECVLDQCLQQCASGVRCGAAQEECCGAGDVCIEDACTTPGSPCQDSFDCGAGMFCEPTLDHCLPQFDPVACEFVPDFQGLTLVEEWAYETDEVISVPAIADIDGDGVTEVVINRVGIQPANQWTHGRIAVLDGNTGAVEWEITDDTANRQYPSMGRSTVGISDVDGDGLPDLVYAAEMVGGLSAIQFYDGTGNWLYRAQASDGTVYRFDVQNGAPSFANFDGDPEAEVVFGASLIDNDGLVVWDQGGNGAGAAFGSPSVYRGGISAIADLTGDGYPEIVSGRHAWWVDWTDGSPPTVVVNELWDHDDFAPEATAPDGYPAVADLDGDGDPEVILVASGTIRVLEGDSGRLWCGIDPSEGDCFLASQRTQPIAIPSGGLGGPPTVADFDGDGRPEVGVAGASAYTVFDFYRAGEDVVVQAGFPAPSLGDIYPRWARTTQDASSNATGSSVFDFQGDGAAEVIYGDECYLRVFDGSNGAILVEIESSSATIHEYPLVVDVDDDGNSEIVVVNNFDDANCDAIPNYDYKSGVHVYGDANDLWVPTRQVWTSHAYHVTNATSAGNAPATELDNWTQPGLNNYRQNVQGEGIFNASDLTVDLNASLASCENNLLDIVATVRNQGSLGVPAGIEVRLYQGVDDTGAFIGSQVTPVSLLPGASTEVVWQLPFDQNDPPLDFYATVDGDDATDGVVNECVEGNNSDMLLDAECIFPG